MGTVFNLPSITSIGRDVGAQIASLGVPNLAENPNAIVMRATYKAFVGNFDALNSREVTYTSPSGVNRGATLYYAKGRSSLYDTYVTNWGVGVSIRDSQYDLLTQIENRIEYDISQGSYIILPNISLSVPPLGGPSLSL